MGEKRRASIRPYLDLGLALPQYLETVRKWRVNSLSYQLKRRKLDAQRDGDHSRIRTEVKKRKEARR